MEMIHRQTLSRPTSTYDPDPGEGTLSSTTPKKFRSLPVYVNTINKQFRVTQMREDTLMMEVYPHEKVSSHAFVDDEVHQGEATFPVELYNNLNKLKICCAIVKNVCSSNSNTHNTAKAPMHRNQCPT